MKHEPICHAYRMDYFVFRNPSAERRNPKTPFTITRSYGMSTICPVKTVLARMNRPAHKKRFAKNLPLAHRYHRLSFTDTDVCLIRLCFVCFLFLRVPPPLASRTIPARLNSGNWFEWDGATVFTLASVLTFVAITFIESIAELPMVANELRR